MGKNIFGRLLGTAAAVTGVGAFLIMPERVDEDLYAPFQRRNIAHRGLHDMEKGIPENSIAAFNAACEAGYGSELDVQLTKDGQVVVFHDDDLKRICGVDARVDSKTLEELEELRLLGTEQGIPLFAEVLAAVDSRTPLIVELKSGPNNEELCEKTYQILAGYEGEYCIESFDPRIVRWFRINAPEIVRGQLACPPEHYGKDANPYTSFLMGNCLMNFLSRPHFIAYEVTDLPITVKAAIQLGAKHVCWTSKSEANEEGCDTVIFEHYLPKVWY
ncbi:MAG: glycerophosphodiester phosphodiesterase [Firmicutes bacterium]|nr:glycerophosphodiester phosphodiesterase [Bacillota bacterium]